MSNAANPVNLEALRAAIRESEQNYYYAETTENGLTGAALFDAQTNTMRIRTQLRGRRAALAARLAPVFTSERLAGLGRGSAFRSTGRGSGHRS